MTLDPTTAYARVRRRWRSLPRGRDGGVRRGRQGRRGSGGRRQGPACEDRGVDAGQRFFSRRARQGRTAGERKTMIDRSHALPVSEQAKALGIRVQVSQPEPYRRPAMAAHDTAGRALPADALEKQAVTMPDLWICLGMKLQAQLFLQCCPPNGRRRGSSRREVRDR